MKRTVIVLLLLTFPFLTGCFGTNDYFKDVRNDVLKSCREDFSRDTEFAIGSAGLSLAGMFVSADDDPVAADIIDDLSEVQVGIYKRKSRDGTYSNYQILRRIDKRMSRFGWKYVVRNCSPDEISAVYINNNIKKGIRSMFVVTLDKDELVLVQLEGNLNRVIETAIRDRGLSYN